MPKAAGQAAFRSDPRLQYRVLTPDTTKEIVVCVVAHVLDEASDRPHALIRRGLGALSSGRRGGLGRRVAPPGSRDTLGRAMAQDQFRQPQPQR